MDRRRKCPRNCQCMCHEFGITAEHGDLDHCPSKDSRPLCDAGWEFYVDGEK